MADKKSGFGVVVGSGKIEEVKMNVAECRAVIEELEGVLCELENRLGNKKKFKLTRKEMVMEAIKDGQEYSIGEIAERVSVMAGISITNKNISSQLTYLRDDLAKSSEYDIVRVGRGHGKLKLMKVG